MTTEFQYDVFLSHNQADKPRVRQLVEGLKEAGLRLWFRKVKRRLQTSAFSLLPSALPDVLWLSPAALGSDWVGLERSTVGRGNCGSRNLRFRDPANAGRRLILLLLANAHHRKEPVAICDLEPA